LSVLLNQQNLVSVATVAGADMKRGKCVVETKVKVEFEDGFGAIAHEYSVLNISIFI